MDHKDFFKKWPEHILVIVLMFGFVISITVSSALLNYLIILAFGMIAGRVIYARKGKGYIVPTILIISGFFLGYVVGGSFRFNKYMILSLFLIGIYVSYKVHQEGYIKI